MHPAARPRLRAGGTRFSMPITLHNVIFWGTVSFLLALLLLFGIDFGIYEPPEVNVGISPRAYPRAVVLVMFCAALYMVLSSTLHHRRVQARAEEADERDAGESFSRKKLLLVGVIIAVYCLIFPYLGLAPASVLAFVLLTRLNGEHNLIRMLCIGAVLAVGLYYFFLYAAAIPMPTGPFGGVI
jgi:uncharacterized membrane protein